jgi:hypothetical protein
MNRHPIKLILVDPNYALATAFQERFAYLPNVEVANCGFEQLNTYDCLVSPANSFGMMDGGVDAAITKFFGISLMERVQQKILDDYLGEQSVGTSLTALWLLPDSFRSGRRISRLSDRSIGSELTDRLFLLHTRNLHC